MEPLVFSTRTTLECDHEFHTDCWNLQTYHATQQGSSPWCPICRRDVDQRFQDFIKDEASNPQTDINGITIDVTPAPGFEIGGPELELPIGHVDFPLPPLPFHPAPMGGELDTNAVPFAGDAASTVLTTMHDGILQMMQLDTHLDTNGHVPFSYLDFKVQLLTSSPITSENVIRLTHEVEHFFIAELTMEGVYILQATMPGPTLDYRAVLALPNAHISQLQDESQEPVSIEMIVRNLTQVRFGDQLSSFSMDPPRIVDISV
jgi:hypothetical protein